MIFDLFNSSINLSIYLNCLDKRYFTLDQQRVRYSERNSVSVFQTPPSLLGNSNNCLFSKIKDISQSQ